VSCLTVVRRDSENISSCSTDIQSTVWPDSVTVFIVIMMVHFTVQLDHTMTDIV